MYSLINQVRSQTFNTNNLADLQERMLIEMVNKTAYHENKMQLGQKHIFHLEAYVANIMLIIKKAIEN